MKSSSADLGLKAENKIALLLTKQGFTVLERRYRVAGGELDLIVQKGTELRFVEVKYRAHTDYGFPYESVTPIKIKRLARAVRMYLYEHPEYQNYSFSCDVAALSGHGMDQFIYYPNAFSLDL